FIPTSSFCPKGQWPQEQWNTSHRELNGNARRSRIVATMIENALASTPKRIIAIIEDDSRMRTSVARLLEAFGFGTETFESAEAFLRASSNACCLLVDINLDKMNGIELALNLGGRGIKYPIIFMTGRDSDSVRRQAVNAG